MAEHEILVVDDDEAVATTIAAILAQDDLGATTAPSGEAALAVLEARAFDLIVTDVRMPGMNGLELLERLRARLPEVPVVLISAHEDTRTAVEAMRAGARDFLLKPLHREDVLRVVRKELGASRVARAAPPPRPPDPGGMLGDSAAMREARELIRKAAPSELRVLLLGEPGTGKELGARALHAQSKRARKPLIRVNCAAIPENLFEAELFGHARGAFTGAVCDKPGRVELAEGGTLFLDEVGELAPGAQAKLLRVLQEGEYERLGDPRTRKADVRVVSATNRPLERLKREGAFRADLYDRLNGVTIHLPPLRERPEDIGALARHFLPGLGDAALEALGRYDWPGNVRELQNVLERLTVFSDDRQNIGPLDVRRELARNAELMRPPSAPRPVMDCALLRDALGRTGGNRAQAARLLGISRRTLYNWLDACGG